MGMPEMGSIPATVRLRDVAAAAGVSLSTASRVLSGADGASPRAIASVLAAAKRLDYRPNLLARGLRGRATGLAGIVIPEIGNPFFAELVEALESALRDANLDMILADSRGRVDDEDRRLQTLVDRQVEGLILIPTDHEASAPALRRAGLTVPIVQIDRQVDGFPADYVGVDNALGIRLALEHLAGQGCRKVAFASAAPSSSTGRSRLDAFRLTLPRVDGLVEGPVLLGSFAIDFGREAARTLAASRSRPDAIVCGSDLIALGVVRELSQRGVPVPQDVSIVGCDDNALADIVDPPLTTIRQPVQAIAAESVRLLQSRMSGESGAARRSEIAPSLVVRRSTT